MEKIYIAAPFSSLTNQVDGRLYGEISDNQFIRLLEKVDALLREEGFAVSLPHRDKGQWGKLYIHPEQIADICFSEVEQCDWLLAIPLKSRAAHMEIAAAMQLRKKLIVLLREDDDPSIFTYGLWKRTPTLVSVFKDETDLVQKVRECVAIMREHVDDETYLQTYSSQALKSFLSHPAMRNTEFPGRESRTCAVIDFGSSSLKLTIAQVKNGFISVLHEDKFSGAPLGDDVHATKNLRIETVDKNIEVIKSWLRKLESYNFQDLRIVATGAARKAQNQEMLLTRVRAATGLDAEIVDEKAEAVILYQGAVYDFPSEDLTFAVLNIGGSTTELIIGTKERIEKVYHFDDIGVRPLRNDYLKSDPPSDKEHAALAKFIDQALSKLDFDTAGCQVIFLHTGGELDYVVSAGCKLQDSALSPSHPKVARLTDFEEFAKKIRKLRSNKLYALAPDPNNPKWMDGAIICNAIAISAAKKLGVEQIIPSNRNLTDGLLLTAERASTAVT